MDNSTVEPENFVNFGQGCVNLKFVFSEQNNLKLNLLSLILSSAVTKEVFKLRGDDIKTFCYPKWEVL